MERDGRAAVVGGAVVEPLPEAPDREGILAEEQLPQPSGNRVRGGHLDDRPRQVRRGVRFADADDPLVGVDADEERVLGPVGATRVDVRETQDDRLDGGDLHGVPSVLLVTAPTDASARPR